MSTLDIIGTIAAVLTTGANIPQTYKIIREKTTEGVSATTYLVLLGGTISWIVYGLMKADWPIFITNAISSCTSIAILVLYHISDRKIEKLHEKLLPDAIQETVRQENENAVG